MKFGSKSKAYLYFNYEYLLYLFYISFYTNTATTTPQHPCGREDIEPPQKYTMFHNFLHVIIFLSLKTSSSSTDNSTSTDVGPLDWDFKEYLTQPDSGIISSLLTTANVGLIVAFQNDVTPGESSGGSPGITWEASNPPSSLIRNGGKLRWSKKTNLLFKTPPSRTQADSAILSWNDGEKEHAVVMFVSYI